MELLGRRADGEDFLSFLGNVVNFIELFDRCLNLYLIALALMIAHFGSFTPIFCGKLTLLVVLFVNDL